MEQTEKKIQAVLFDMDGVLFDTEKLYQETWHELADEYGVTLPEDFDFQISGTSGVHMQKVVSSCYQTDTPVEIIEKCMERMKQKEEFDVPMKPGVLEILTFLKEKQIPVVIASSSTIENIEHNLQVTGIRSYFDALTSGREVEHGKPAPDVFLLAAKRAGRPAENCVVIEDSGNGIRAGHAAGCYTIMVPDLIRLSKEIEPLCSAVCKDLILARDWIAERI